MYKLFTGTTPDKARQLAKEDGIQLEALAVYYDSLEEALTKSRGAVIELVFDELPPTLKNYRLPTGGSGRRLNAYKIPRAYYNNTLRNWFEQASVIRQEMTTWNLSNVRTVKEDQCT